MASTLRVMVLAGGPDRERDVSLASGAQVAAALREAGHEVVQHDITPEDLSALDAFTARPHDVIFPVLHGAWGEGGGLQAILEERGLPFVGSGADASRLCMDKNATKLALCRQKLPTPTWEVVEAGHAPVMTPPVVIKPLREGSSIDLFICRNRKQVAAAMKKLAGRHDRLLVEHYVAGRELTVGVLERDADGAFALPPIQIVPATSFYDYKAKYERDDTKYRFDIEPAALIERVKQLAVQAHRLLGCRHLSRVDFMVDRDDQPFVLEVNTLPGFTAHSLLPMAAAHAGMAMPALVDHLVRQAVRAPLAA